VRRSLARQHGLAPVVILLGVAVLAVGTLGVTIATTRGEPEEPTASSAPSPSIAPTPSPSASPRDRDTPRETRTPQFRRCRKTATRLQDIADELSEVWITTVETVNGTQYINVNTGEAVQALKTFSARLEVLRARLKPLRIPSRLAAPERRLRNPVTSFSTRWAIALPLIL
jgi:hypothetical protein